MKIRAPSRYAILGASLALMLLTNYRFAGPVGFGEILALMYIALALVSWLLSPNGLRFRKTDKLTGTYIAVVVLVIVPMTFYSSAMNIPGSSYRDLFAYGFVCAILLSLPRVEQDLRTMIVAFLVVLFATIIFQYLLGGTSAYYSLRFTGGAKNPNQLALYLTTAIVFSTQLKNNLLRVGVVLLSVFFGLLTLSDAYMVFLVVSLVCFITLMLLPPKAVLLALPLFLVSLYYVVAFSEIGTLLLFQWTLADQGGSRTQLYLSALSAWLDTPLAFVFGNGAGSFSGLSGPFEKAEAHNTPLDLASIAGVFGLFLFPVLPLWITIRSLSKDFRFAPAVFMGLVVFAFFHFAGRQPVFWVCIAVYARLIQWERPPKRSWISPKSNMKRVRI